MCYLKRKFSGDLSLKVQPHSGEKATNTINCPLLGILYFLDNREAMGKDELDAAFGAAPGCNVEKKGEESKRVVGRSRGNSSRRNSAGWGRGNQVRTMWGRSPVGDALDLIMKAGTSGGARFAFASGRLDNGRSGPQKPSMWLAEGAK